MGLRQSLKVTIGYRWCPTTFNGKDTSFWIESDLNSIPKHQRGSITTLWCIIKQMVVRNQEARDALETYIKTFDITKFPCKNVPTACLCLKAVAQALGENDLLTNLVHKNLEDFVKSSTKLFNKFCASQIALRRGNFYWTLMKNTSLQNQLNNVLNDLETSYLDLVGGKLWAGINSSPQGSAFIVGCVCVCVSGLRLWMGYCNAWDTNP